MVQGDVYEYDPTQNETKIEPIILDAKIDHVQAMAQILLSLSHETQIGPAASGQGRFSGDSGYLQAQADRAGEDGLSPGAQTRVLGALRHVQLDAGDHRETRSGARSGRLRRSGLRAQGRRQRRWLSLTPQQIDGYYNVDVQIRTHNPIMGHSHRHVLRQQGRTRDDLAAGGTGVAGARAARRASGRGARRAPVGAALRSRRPSQVAGWRSWASCARSRRASTRRATLWTRSSWRRCWARWAAGPRAAPRSQGRGRR